MASPSGLAHDLRLALAEQAVAKGYAVLVRSQDELHPCDSTSSWPFRVTEYVIRPSGSVDTVIRTSPLGDATKTAWRGNRPPIACRDFTLSATSTIRLR
jgi:hypothetical protein